MTVWGFRVIDPASHSATRLPRCFQLLWSSDVGLRFDDSLPRAGYLPLVTLVQSFVHCFPSALQVAGAVSPMTVTVSWRILRVLASPRRRVLFPAWDVVEAWYTFPRGPKEDPKRSAPPSSSHAATNLVMTRFLLVP